MSQGTLRRDPYDELHPALPKRKRRHLKYEDLTKLMATQLDKPNLQRVRDWFIFSTFTGLAYADLKRLSEKDIIQKEDGSQWIRIRRKKTDVASYIRLLYEGENETYIEASVENSSSILYDKEIRNKPRTRRTKRNV